MNKHTIYIDGGAGTTGLQIAERLAGQSGITLLSLPEENRKSLPQRLQAIEQADATVLCLPDAAAAEIAAAAPAAARIIDASTAHRTKAGWVYGFAELAKRRAQIKTANRVCVPGCHATGFLALAAPLVEKSLVLPGTPLHCHSLTGYSGGGKQMIAAYEDPARPAGYSAPRPYALGLSHKHLPEMQTIAGLAVPPLFTPVVDNYYNGMLVSVALPYTQLAAGYQTPGEVLAFYQNYYRGEALIQVLGAQDAPPDGTLPANALAGRDTLEIWVLGNEKQLLLAARLDNLGKGASGAAVQCLNLMLGRDELEGLRL